jgi:hypothetical protein
MWSGIPAGAYNNAMPPTVFSAALTREPLLMQRFAAAADGGR